MTTKTSCKESKHEFSVSIQIKAQVNFKNRGAQALRALDPSHIDTRRISHACISHTSH